MSPAVDLPPVVVTVARVGPNAATLAELSVRSTVDGAGVCLTVRGLLPRPTGGFYAAPPLSRAVVLPPGGALGPADDVADCHRRIEEAVDARAGAVWDALAAECRTAGLELDP